MLDHLRCSAHHHFHISPPQSIQVRLTLLTTIIKLLCECPRLTCLSITTCTQKNPLQRTISPVSISTECQPQQIWQHRTRSNKDTSMKFQSHSASVEHSNGYESCYKLVKLKGICLLIPKSTWNSTVGKVSIPPLHDVHKINIHQL